MAANPASGQSKLVNGHKISFTPPTQRLGVSPAKESREDRNQRRKVELRRASRL